MASFFLNAGVLFNIAITAYKETLAEKSINENAMIACVFSAVAMEAFINELGAMTAAIPAKFESEPQKLVAIGEMLKYAEESRGSIEMKYELVRWICTGRFFEKGVKVYQDFADLIAIRNALVHYKIEKIPLAEDVGNAKQAAPKVIERLRSRNVLADIQDGVVGAWIHKIGTAATARWACEATVGIVHETISCLPEGLFKQVAGKGLGEEFQLP